MVHSTPDTFYGLILSENENLVTDFIYYTFLLWPYGKKTLKKLFVILDSITDNMER